MSSLIEGYNYYIFISYRQKDNKGEKWVSEFVDAMKDGFFIFGLGFCTTILGFLV